jgi:hypothetical protein
MHHAKDLAKDLAKRINASLKLIQSAIAHSATVTPVSTRKSIFSA